MKPDRSLVNISGMMWTHAFFRDYCGSAALPFALLLFALQPAVCRELPTVGGNSISLTGGAPTVVTVITKDREDQAKRVGSYLSDEEIAKNQVIAATVLNFEGKLKPSMEKLTAAQIELDLKKESARLGPKYRHLGVDQSPLQNLHVVADYDGSITRSLGVDSAEHPVVVLIYDKSGNLKARFPGLPGRKQFREYLDPLL